MEFASAAKHLLKRSVIVQALTGLCSLVFISQIAASAKEPDPPQWRPTRNSSVEWRFAKHYGAHWFSGAKKNDCDHTRSPYDYYVTVCVFCGKVSGYCSISIKGAWTDGKSHQEGKTIDSKDILPGQVGVFDFYSYKSGLTFQILEIIDYKSSPAQIFP